MAQNRTLARGVSELARELKVYRGWNLDRLNFDELEELEAQLYKTLGKVREEKVRKNILRFFLVDFLWGHVLETPYSK